MSNKKNVYQLLENLLDILSNMNNEDIKNLRELLRERKTRNEIIHSYIDRPSLSTYSNNLNNRIDKNKKELIGTLPNILVSTEYFPSNKSLNQFAKELGFDIAGFEKKKKDEIIGRIIIKVSEFDPNKIDLINNILNSVLDKVKKGNINEFFLEWDKAIKGINIRG